MDAAALVHRIPSFGFVLKEVASPGQLNVAKLQVKTFIFTLHVVNSNELNLDPDPVKSVKNMLRIVIAMWILIPNTDPSKVLNTDSMRIRIHNTAFTSFDVYFLLFANLFSTQDLKRRNKTSCTVSLIFTELLDSRNCFCSRQRV